MMITPLAYSYTEKQEIELERLLAEYILKDPDDGGKPVIELVDFTKLTQNEIDVLKVELVDLEIIMNQTRTDIAVQKITIQKEENAIVIAQELVQKEWNAAPVNTLQLLTEHVKLNDLMVEMEKLLSQKETILKKIAIKEMLQEIKEHDAKLIGVRLSNNCIAMAKVGDGSCPTYEDLLPLDNSNLKISGEFSVYDGFFHREKSNFIHSYRFYDTEDTIRIIVDPHQELSARIKMITIESGFSYYTDVYDKLSQNNTVTLSKDRIIIDCYTANISADDWKMLLPDTIFTFRNGCTSAEINDEVTFQTPHTKIDMSTSPNVQYQFWLKEAIVSCKVLC